MEEWRRSMLENQLERVDSNLAYFKSKKNTTLVNMPNANYSKNKIKELTLIKLAIDVEMNCE